MKKLITYKTKSKTIEFIADVVDALEMCKEVECDAKEKGIDLNSIVYINSKMI